MNDDTKEFIEELKARADVLGVIMFGSWARGDNRPNSDVDLVVIQRDGHKRTVEYKNNQVFEIIYTTSKSALEFWQSNKDECAGLWEVAKIAYDKDGTVAELKVHAEGIIKEGKKPIDEYQKGQYKFSAEDEIRAADAGIGKDDATANLVLMHTVYGLTGLFFDLRQIWTPAPKQRLTKLNELHPELGTLFKRFYSDKITIKNKVELAKQIVPLVFACE